MDRGVRGTPGCCGETLSQLVSVLVELERSGDLLAAGVLQRSGGCSCRALQMDAQILMKLIVRLLDLAWIRGQDLNT